MAEIPRVWGCDSVRFGASFFMQNYGDWGRYAERGYDRPPARADILFEMPPEERLPAAMMKLGISFSQLSDTPGHA